MLRWPAAAALLALAAASPALTQASSDDAAAEDLRCATWAAIAIGVNEENPEIAAGLSSALTWFLGSYEAATGVPFEDALTPEYIAGLAPEIGAIEPVCQQRVKDLGGRLQEWGKYLQGAELRTLADARASAER